MRTRSTRFWIALVALALLGPSLSMLGCKTVQGLGEDIKSAGQAGEEAITGDKNDD